MKPYRCVFGQEPNGPLLPGPEPGHDEDEVNIDFSQPEDEIVDQIRHEATRQKTTNNKMAKMKNS